MVAHLLKYPLAPVLLLEGRRLRARAPTLPEATGPREGTAGQGPALSLLIAGDSSAAGVGVAHQCEALAGQTVAALEARFAVHWRLEARTGDTTLATTRRLAALPPEPFDAALLALGVNDVTSGIPPWLWIRRTRALQRLLRERFGVRRIYHSGLPPMADFPLLPPAVRLILGAEARRFDRALARLCHETPDAVHVPGDPHVLPEDMAEDGFHPGAPIYRIWGRRAAAAIAADFTGKGDSGQ